MDQYGSDFITIVDEDGTEYELEVLSTLEYNGSSYMAVIPAASSAPNLSRHFMAMRMPASMNATNSAITTETKTIYFTSPAKRCLEVVIANIKAKKP